MMESEAEGRDCSSWMEPLPEAESGVRRNSKGDKGRRFSEEQIKSLESMFEAQVKLEPRQKLELARELGLQPRQVAIWFQNKRARWKSKQLEREYRALKTEYDALLASFESLKKEKQILLAQLQTLEELLDKAEERSPDGGDAATKNEERPRLLLKEEPELELAGSADEEDKNLNYLKKEEAALGQPASSSLTLPAAEQQFCFTTSSWPSDQSGGHSHWWEFWPPRG